MSNEVAKAWATAEVANARYDAAVARLQDRQSTLKSANEEAQFRRENLKGVKDLMKKGAETDQNLREARNNLALAESRVVLAQAAQAVELTSLREAAAERVRAERELAELSSDDKAKAVIVELAEAYATLVNARIA